MRHTFLCQKTPLQERRARSKRVLGACWGPAPGDSPHEVDGGHPKTRARSLMGGPPRDPILTESRLRRAWASQALLSCGGIEISRSGAGSARQRVGDPRFGLRARVCPVGAQWDVHPWPARTLIGRLSADLRMFPLSGAGGRETSTTGFGAKISASQQNIHKPRGCKRRSPQSTTPSSTLLAGSPELAHPHATKAYPECPTKSESWGHRLRPGETPRGGRRAGGGTPRQEQRRAKSARACAGTHPPSAARTP